MNDPIIQLVKAFNSIEWSLIETRKACEILAIVHFSAGRLELSLDPVFYQAIRLAQHRMGLFPGSAFIHQDFQKIYQLSEELKQKGKECEWFKPLTEKYPVLKSGIFIPLQQ
jgi:hypothetical protein